MAVHQQKEEGRGGAKDPTVCCVPVTDLRCATSHKLGIGTPACHVHVACCKLLRIGVIVLCL